MLIDDNVSPALIMYRLHPAGGLQRVLAGVALAGESDGVTVVVTDGDGEEVGVDVSVGESVGVNDKVLVGVFVLESVGAIVAD